MPRLTPRGHRVVIGLAFTLALLFGLLFNFALIPC